MAVKGAPAKWLLSHPVSIKSKMSICSASGCDTQQAATHAHTNKKAGAAGVKAYIFQYLSEENEVRAKNLLLQGNQR